MSDQMLRWVVGVLCVVITGTALGSVGYCVGLGTNDVRCAGVFR